MTIHFIIVIKEDNNLNRGFEILPEFKDEVARLEIELGISFIPQRATKGSSGYDIRTLKDVTLRPGDITLVPTGLTAKMLTDEELQLRGRSGLALKGLCLANGVGTIDSDYYGKHIQFIYNNRGSETIELKAGDRIGQGIFARYLITDEDSPQSSERNGGFGSSGNS